MLKRTSFRSKLPPRPATQWTGGAITPRSSALRIDDGKARMVVPIAKDSPERNEHYRRAIAALACSFCGVVGFSQAAHGPSLGRGIKASDADVFPLCCDRPGVAGCHGKFDRYELFDRWARDVWAEKWAIEARRALT